MTGRRTRRAVAALVLGIVMATTAAIQVAAQTAAPAPNDGSSMWLRIKPLPEGVRRVRLEPDGSGGHWYVLELVGGGEERVRPAELAARLDRDHRDQHLLYRLLNITSPVGIVWVALGLFGQLLFTGRMLLQWVISERAQRSVVPVGFWWMSLAGASMLLVYFIWRRDIVGVLGQSAGWLIYARNLRLIYGDPHPPSQGLGARG